MTQDVQSLIDAIASGDSIAIEQAFQSEMANRISDRLEDMRVEVAQNMFNEEPDISEETELNLEDYSLDELEDFMVSEDFEQLDEISGEMLGRYVQKARDNVATMDVHSRKLDNDPKVKAVTDKLRYLYSRRDWGVSPSLRMKPINALHDKKIALKKEIDPSWPDSVNPNKRNRGIVTAMTKLQYGKLSALPTKNKE